jgi:hypothetical protein
VVSFPPSVKVATESFTWQPIEDGPALIVNVAKLLG